MITTIVFGLIGLFVLIYILSSFRKIDEDEIGLVIKNISLKKLPNDNPIAFNGEAGYQAELLMPGLRFKWSIFYSVKKYPWVQIPSNEIGVAIAQIGLPLSPGAKSGVYKKEFGNYVNLEAFIKGEGQKGVQRQVLPPGTLAPIHPIAFLVITKGKVYGLPLDPQLQHDKVSCHNFNIEPYQLNVVTISPTDEGNIVGVVTTLEGKPLTSGSIAARLGGYKDIEELEVKYKNSPELNSKVIETILNDKNEIHDNYQDFQAFISAGGEMGLQHDVLKYGNFNLNPFLVRVEKVPMLVVNQGEVAVIKSYVGLIAQDTSGIEFKYGTLVSPGHKGIWNEPLRTGMYAINPRIYHHEIVPTSILNLNWAKAISAAHQLDSKLEPIIAKSNEGFHFSIDLQVLIHVPDTKASKVISMVGTMQNLVNEVLQAAVGNLFRDKLGGMKAIKFIETRESIQLEAFEHISKKLQDYDIETKGVYIQNVIYPEALVEVLTTREIANQQIKTLEAQRAAQETRIQMEKTKGIADAQAALAKSEIGITINENDAKAKKAQADGDATYTEKTGAAKAAEVRAVGLAQAEAYERQQAAIGKEYTAIVNIVKAAADIKHPFIPQTLVMGSGGSIEGAFATLMGFLQKKTNTENEKKLLLEDQSTKK